jgi:hypothetical protein
MKISGLFACFVLIAILVLGLSIFGQKGSTETYTGTVISYGTGLNTRTTTSTFTLNIDSLTPDDQAQRFLGLLQEGGQNVLLRELSKENRGNFSVGARLGRRLNAIRENIEDRKKRIFIVFERWMEFGEIRGGYRSIDYPFGVIELYIDPRTGKGEGTYIAAAKIRWTQDKKSGQYQVEIENFATFPAKLVGVMLRGRR